LPNSLAVLNFYKKNVNLKKMKLVKFKFPVYGGYCDLGKRRSALLYRVLWLGEGFMLLSIIILYISCLLRVLVIILLLIVYRTYCSADSFVCLQITSSAKMRFLNAWNQPYLCSW